MPIITISRQMGSLGDEIAQLLAGKLGWDLLDHASLTDLFFKDSTDARERHLLSESARFFLAQSSTGQTYLEHLTQGLTDLAANKNLILLGFGSQMIFADHPAALHIRIFAAKTLRQHRVSAKFRVLPIQSAEILENADRRHRRFVQIVFGADCTNEVLYHAVFNTGLLSSDEVVQAIEGLLTAKIQRLSMPGGVGERSSSEPSKQPVLFKNTSEAEFAQILDMHQIHWVYEPKTFPVEWDAEGNVTLAFSPDFYLTQFDTYIELTTMNQRYVSEKKKKLRRVRELYPGIQISIVYKKDFAELIERFSQFSR